KAGTKHRRTGRPETAAVERHAARLLPGIEQHDREAVALWRQERRRPYVSRAGGRFHTNVAGVRVPRVVLERVVVVPHERLLAAHADEPLATRPDQIPVEPGDDG